MSAFEGRETMEQCTSHLVPHFEGYPAVVKEKLSVHVLELGGNWKDLFFFGSFHVLCAGFLLLSWLMLGFFSMLLNAVFGSSCLLSLAVG